MRLPWEEGGERRGRGREGEREREMADHSSVSHLTIYKHEANT